MMRRPSRALAGNGGAPAGAWSPSRGLDLRRCEKSGVTRPSRSSRKPKSLSLDAAGSNGTSLSGCLQTGAPERQRPTSRAATHSVEASSGMALACRRTSRWALTWAHQPGTSWARRRTTWKEPFFAQAGKSVLLPGAGSSPMTNSPAGTIRLPGWPATSSGSVVEGGSKPSTPGSLMPSLKPKCSLPRRVPSRVAAFCWKTITIRAWAAASRCSSTAARRSSAVSAAMVSTACTGWVLPLPNSQPSGEFFPLSPSAPARLAEPSLKASSVPPVGALSYGSLPVSSRRPG